jgi:hypothetical protein
MDNQDNTGDFFSLVPSANFGWVNDPVEVQAVVATLPFKDFGDTPAAGFAADQLPDHAYLWDFAREVTGDLLVPQNQLDVGSCVAMGCERAVNYTLCAEIANGFAYEHAYMVQEAIYGLSRVEIGNKKLGRGDGSIGAWAADAVKKYGVIKRGVYLNGKYDLTKYSTSRCRDWGWSGLPDDLEPEAKMYPVKEIVPVKNWLDAKKALVQGYGISVASDQGFSMKRDSNGVSKASGSWAHQMCICGYATINGEEYGRIDNSWGKDAHTGPTGPGNPGPEGFYAHWKTIERMLKQDDSFAYAGVTGFPLRKLRWKI